jgi:hypothetical protein
MAGAWGAAGRIGDLAGVNHNPFGRERGSEL